MRSLRTIELPIADQLVERRDRGAPPSRARDLGGERVGIGAERRRERAADARVRAEHLGAPTPRNARGPALGVEPAAAPRPSTSTSRGRCRSGSTRIEFGPQNGVCVKCDDAQVRARSREHHAGHQRELVVVHQHRARRSPASSTTASANARFTATYPSHASRKCRSNRGRRARSNRPWWRNHSVAFDTTS